MCVCACVWGRVGGRQVYNKGRALLLLFLLFDLTFISCTLYLYLKLYLNITCCYVCHCHHRYSCYFNIFTVWFFIIFWKISEVRGNYWDSVVSFPVLWNKKRIFNFQKTLLSMGTTTILSITWMLHLAFTSRLILTAFHLDILCCSIFLLGNDIEVTLLMFQVK